MAVALEFIDIIVPIAVIRRKYYGGWEKFLYDKRRLIGGALWHDDHLFRDGAMSPGDAKTIVDDWTRLGFEAMEIRDGRQVWKDLCVVEWMFGGPTLPCDWIEVDENEPFAYLKGTAPGNVAGPRRE
jgi:hypothetical protein